MTPHDSGSAERRGLSRESGLERGDRRSFWRDLFCTCLGRSLDLGRQRGFLLCEQAIPLGLASYVGIARLAQSILVGQQRAGERTFRRFCSSGLVLLGVLALSAPILCPVSAPVVHTRASGGGTHAPFDHSWASRASASAAAFAFLPSAASSLRACVRAAVRRSALRHNCWSDAHLGGGSLGIRSRLLKSGRVRGCSSGQAATHAVRTGMLFNLSIGSSGEAEIKVVWAE